MDTHRLRNLHRPDILRERLEREGLPRTTLSFYRYVRLSEVEELRNALYLEWEALGVLGRIYISQEGINAQVSIPSADLEAFRTALDARDAFANVPWKIAVEDDGKSFLKLMVKVKKKIVADGLADDAFDVTDVGEHLDAATFNQKLEEGAVVVDMRNNYECLIGHFEGAYLPKADTFRGAIEEVLVQLEGKQNEPVLMYCTGGIRCEKASAYLRHHGFTQVGQLHGGIIDYARQLKAEGLPSKYKGQNFVFDERLAERITEDVVSTCMQCGGPCDRITNCHEVTCNMLLVQCPDCAAKYADCCSPSCREVHVLPEEVQRIWRKGRSTRSTKTKAINDPEALRQRIHDEEAILASKGTLHPELIGSKAFPPRQMTEISPSHPSGPEISGRNH
ncbi:MAG: rhodanese-related sulfurtransferase [Flavobacteriales bacterium]|nr:rhodanese-related sulfurtransferase [Flavobacteriales bacterium]